MSQKVIAFAADVVNCPLYKVGDRLAFTPPEVAGEENAPVCGVLVQTCWPVIHKIQRGRPAAKFERTYCGGCPAGKAWFSFVAAEGFADDAVAQANARLVIEVLGKFPLFAGVPPKQIEKSVPLWDVIQYPDGEMLLRKGEPGKAFYVLLEGEIDIVQADDSGNENVLAALKRGDCLGEMSLITGNPVSASARAKGGISVLRVSRDNFPNLLSAVPALNFKLAKVLAQRLAKTGSWISDELNKGVMGKFEMISPMELIQAMSVNSQTGTLRIQNGERTGFLYFDGGQVFDVQVGPLSGEEAFYQFMSWNKGTFRLEPGKRAETVRRVKSDTMGMLLEGMRRLDEAATRG
jgi:CRP-like cAMP-binding protein